MSKQIIQVSLCDKVAINPVTSLSVNTRKHMQYICLCAGGGGEGRRVQETASSVQPSAAPAVYGVETCAPRRGRGETRTIHC